MREFKRVILESSLIAVVGIGIALAANAKNPNGLQLGKNYFAIREAPKPPIDISSRPTDTQSQPESLPVSSESKEVWDMVVNNGLNPTNHAMASKLFRDPGYERGLYVFLDARPEDLYVAGHIPGAYSLPVTLTDEALKKQFFEEFVPMAAGAEKVIVYCSGGHCDDSVQVAQELPLHGLDPARVLVDVDGFNAWKESGLPIERGFRLSGDILEGKK